MLPKWKFMIYVFFVTISTLICSSHYIDNLCPCFVDGRKKKEMKKGTTHSHQRPITSNRKITLDSMMWNNLSHLNLSWTGSILIYKLIKWFFVQLHWSTKLFDDCYLFYVTWGWGRRDSSEMALYKIVSEIFSFLFLINCFRLLNLLFT